MSEQRIKKEIKSIIDNEKYPFPLNLAMASSWLILNLKGAKVKILDMREKSSLADYYVIASINNPTQADSISKHLISYLKAYTSKIAKKEGTRDSDWILLDQGNVLTHLVLEDSRDEYKFDELWKDSPTIEIPEEFYFQKFSLDQDDDQDEKNNDDPFDGYL